MQRIEGEGVREGIEKGPPSNVEGTPEALSPGLDTYLFSSQFAFSIKESSFFKVKRTYHQTVTPSTSSGEMILSFA